MSKLRVLGAYHTRRSAETTFHTIKSKFEDSVHSKADVA